MARTLPIALLVFLLSVPALAQEDLTEEEQQAEMCTTKTATLKETRGGYHTGDRYVEEFQAQATLTVTNPCDEDRLLVEITTAAAEFDFGCWELEIHQPIIRGGTDERYKHHRHVHRGHGYASDYLWPEEANGYVSLHYPGNRGGACPRELNMKEGETRRFWISFDLNRIDNTKPFAPLEPFQVVYEEAVVLTFP